MLIRDSEPQIHQFFIFRVKAIVNERLAGNLKFMADAIRNGTPNNHAFWMKHLDRLNFMPVDLKAFSDNFTTENMTLLKTIKCDYLVGKTDIPLIYNHVMSQIICKENGPKNP